ncbi:50S ribosomal protein L28 [candidate division WWE3 bacterium CG08_land_8_20_14_0_20_43_13]|uniref:Large ribosomal subunit protein bL28 n=1 Tax=candidate division WWE3 bacterium CG08_land_8_20_14_0_20_43_13 TaxID=1975087 RepID=A0A2H0X766_UNCKA|nr:MAG: 50S ribosomal protein L28 [candidate division WWE3 bacterium CG08_land_8_20_14_0_20_43_13]
MSRICQQCGKKYLRGNLVSHSAHKTIRRSQPNLHSVRVQVGSIAQRMKLCTKCIKQTKVTTS